MAYTPVVLTKNGKTRTASTLEEEIDLRWDGWLPTGSAVPYPRPLKQLVGAETEAALGAAYGAAVQQSAARGVTGLSIRNPDKLSRWETALAAAGSTPAIVTVVGDSIAWGIGSDGDPNGTSDNAVYRQQAWPVVLRKLFARSYGTRVAENHVGAAAGWGYTTVTGGVLQSSTGSFGRIAGLTHGGVSLTGAAQTVALASGVVGQFTDLDVLWWGTDSGTAGVAPAVSVDGGNQIAGTTTTQAGNLNKSTVSGLSDATHAVTVSGTASGIAYVTALVPRYSKGVVVNRIAVPGATSTDATGGDLTGQGKQRNIDAAVLKGYSHLVILALGANDLYQQVPLATYQANLQALIDSATGGGAAVLLLGAPPVSGGSGYAIPEDSYRTTMSTLSDNNANVAYADLRPLFGDQTQAYNDGLLPNASTVHPSRRGHRLVGRAVFDALPLASV